MGGILKKLLPLAVGFAAPALGVGALGSAALGAGAGAIGGGGLKGALLGGLSGYAGAGGFGGASSLGSAATSEGLLNASRGAVSGFSLPTGGTLANTAGGVGTALRNGIGNIASSSKVGDVISTIGSLSTQDEMKKKLLAAQNQAQSALSPYVSAGAAGINALQSGFDPSQLTSDAGYQFRLNQGQQALERSLAARGLGDSGAALKAAQDYGQGLAAQSYNDAYSQWLARNSGLAGYGANATGQLNDIYGNIGNIGANNALAQSNTLSAGLSNLLRGSSKPIIGYDESGNPIYGA